MAHLISTSPNTGDGVVFLTASESIRALKRSRPEAAHYRGIDRALENAKRNNKRTRFTNVTADGRSAVARPFLIFETKRKRRADELPE